MSANGGGTRLVEPNGVYVILWDMGDLKTFHWGIFIALSSTNGFSFHCTNSLNTNNEWVFKERANYSVMDSRTFLCALKISEVVSVDESMLRRIKERLSGIEFKKNVDDCRSWAMRAVYLLVEEGFIGLPLDRVTIDGIEMEANKIATICKRRALAQVVTSEHYHA